MLKALELAGFKSFADRTRFDFPDGITVVVGPNGSGKSNIVDAMKWVLGTQSAKALRGKEMSDVIFKGSQTRGPAGAAEVSIIFDNPDGVLPVDAPEVRVTRRVYRSGEGEYLINNQAVRLKDVRDLIRGSGIGIDAYSLIEQGKVDKMLQAGAKDRRAIFEEAAGISRFKAKKIEAERRLTRVQGNLTRLADIVDEVALRLKNLRAQASRAERYRQSSERMRELRTQLAWTDWTGLSAEIDRLQNELDAAKQNRDRLDALRGELMGQRRTADVELQRIATASAELEVSLTRFQNDNAKISGDLRGESATITTLRQNVRDVNAEGRRTTREMRAIRIELERSRGQEDRDGRAVDALRQQLRDAERQRDDISKEWEDLRARRSECQQTHLRLTRHLADLGAADMKAAARGAAAARSLQELSQRRHRAADDAGQAETMLREATTRASGAKQSRKEVENQWNLIRAAVEESRRTLDRRRDELADLQIEHERVSERLKVLRDLEEKQTGLSGGVREILSRLKEDQTLHRSIRGLVADVIQTDVETAVWVDAALGEQTQAIVTRDGVLQQQILDGRLEIPSRVALVRMDELPRRRPGDRIRLDGMRGVVGRADRIVKYQDADETLVRHLLSSTWIVDSLDTAMGLRKLAGAGLRFVTVHGELLDSDGTLIVGPMTGSGGLVRRRSETSDATERVEHLASQLGAGREAWRALEGQLESQSAELLRLQSELQSASAAEAAAVAEQRHRKEAVDQKNIARDDLENAAREAARERDEAQNESERLTKSIADHRDQLQSLDDDMVHLDEMIGQSDESLSAVAEGLMQLNVELARVDGDYQTSVRQREATEQKLADVRRQNEANGQQRKTFARRKTQTHHRWVTAGDRLAQNAWDVQQTQGAIRDLQRQSTLVRSKHGNVIAAAEAAISDAASAAAAVQTLESRLESARLERERTADRLAEDYEIDLRHEEVPDEFAPPEDREAVEREIANLRGQLHKSGNVNLEALAELEELQARYDHLHGQYQDLTAAKESLQRMIGRINADSKRLFMDTLEAIRVNFTQLYRKSFGGGHADLILEEGEDPLEAGVEIVATPPGKPSFNNSLLSGGEKALTAVALLMAIFKYRPSPFCVLDEVDAPFDEANIGRFVTVLNEFLDHSKFVVVTHSKKTMTAATTLYGVTMQESGVSKQVSIRFEDVSDDGEIAAA